MAFETITVETEGALGYLTLNRPDQLNAIGATMPAELVEAVRWFDAHLEVRVVIVRGAGRCFSAGADLRDPPTVVGGDDDWQVRRETG